MKIYIVSCVFPPEPVVSAQTSAQIAEEMSELGHQVKVLAPLPSRPTRHDYWQYRRSLLRNETVSPGYEIVRCFSFFSAVSELGSRVFVNHIFGF
jgi:hypothetical protein